MPVVLGKNIAVSHEVDTGKADFRRIQSRRQSRVCVYLNTVNVTDEEEEFTVFKESDVKNLLTEKQERKQKYKFEKLKLVWKGTYKLSKSPQEALQELLFKTTTKCKVRLNPLQSHPPRKPKKASYSPSRSKKSSCQSSITPQEHPTASDKENFSKSKLLNPILSINSHSPDASLVTSKNEYPLVKSSTEELWHSKEESSVSHNFPHYVKRFSRSIFNTKKATDNQEHNLFSYRAERKKQLAETKSCNTIPPCVRNIQSTVTTETEQRKSIDSIKAIEKEMKLKREKLVPELKSRVDVDTILRAYLSEEFLELNLQGPEAIELRRLYTATILNQPVVHNLIMKHPNMLPSRIFKDLVIFKKGFEVNPIYSPTVVKTDEGSWRQTFHRTLSSPSGNVLIELENDMPLYANFYKTLIDRRMNETVTEMGWLKERKPQAIRENLLHTMVNLRIGRHNPGSTARFDIIQLFIAAGRNDRLLRHLGLTVEGWLDQLVKGLYSPFKSVREETCQVLCYMTSNYPVMRELYLSKYFDVVQDLSVTVLRAIDQFEDTFSEYYILLAHIIHYCPSRSVLDCIVERWMNFRSIGIILRWPRLVYYALRYWPDDALCLGSRLFSIRVTRALENALQRPITAKVSRCALYYLQVRFSNVSSLFSVYYNKESAQSSFLEALAVK